MFKKYAVTLMDNKWDIIIPHLKVRHIPRAGELIYITSESTYYKVLNVIHNITKKHEIFIIVEIFQEKS